MSLEFGSDNTLQIRCSYMIEKYKKKLQKVKQLKRDIKASLEKKSKEFYMDRYFLNKEKEHLYSELAKEKEKMEIEHLEKTKELYNSYFADIFLYEQEYYQCIYKVFKNLLLKKEEIDDKERRVLKLQEHARMTLSDRNVSEGLGEKIRENKNAHSNGNEAVEKKTGRAYGASDNHQEKTEHGQDDNHFDIDNLCDLNINEIYQSIILDQGERPHNLSNKGDEFSKSITGLIQEGTHSPQFLDEQYEFGTEQCGREQSGSEQCSNVSRREGRDRGEEGIEKSATCKKHEILELSSLGKGNAPTEELRNRLKREDNSEYDEAIQENVPTSLGQLRQTDWHAGGGREADGHYPQDVRYKHGVMDWDDAAEDDHSGGGKKVTHREDDKESTHSKSGGTEQCEEMSEEREEGEDGEVEPGGSIHFVHQKEEIKCLANEETCKGEEDDQSEYDPNEYDPNEYPPNEYHPSEYHPNGNDAYITSEHLEAAECMQGEEADERHRRSVIDVNPLSHAVKEELRNNDLFEKSEVENRQQDNAELDQVIENNIDFNISSYFSGSYDDIADCAVLERIDEEVVALNDDGGDDDGDGGGDEDDLYYGDDEPEYDMIKERDSGVDPEELKDSSEKDHGREGDTQNGEICTVGDPTEQMNPNRQIGLELQRNQTSPIKKEEYPPQGNNPFSSFKQHINNFYTEYEHMRRFNENNHNIKSSIFNTLYSYDNDYSIPIEKMKTFENYVEEIGQLEPYEHILSFINGGGEEQPAADCDDDPNESSHVIRDRPVETEVNSNLGLHTVKELINYVSASAKENQKEPSVFKKKYRENETTLQ
ncbi:hypothetical protein C922_05197 [Plasmodium inui San Antonio 1]|uniref:Uncharacterized protein n=1 Tax=Plasmodium inui San Antonio 1 TaxID=1237626 RepID=W6ZTZ9_9APIC|nr:hypothetical protein C922_05197 [Plasmodium inui San Antonio 1]EUD64422.1 hypothetical protein C922_05197 [Plasmodium inui San Antonio 1]